MVRPQTGGPQGDRRPQGGPYVHRVESASSKDGLTFVADGRRLLEHASVPATVALPDGRIRIYYVDASKLPEMANVAESADEGRSFRVLGLEIRNWPKVKALDPAIVRLKDGRWRLFSFACDRDPNHAGPHEIHSAISEDGVHFTAEGLAFAREGLVDPDVWWNGKEWLMYVMSLTDRCTIVARSEDGLHFTYAGPLSLRNWGTTAPIPAGAGQFRLYAFDQRGQRRVGSFLSADGQEWKPEAGDRLTVGHGHQVTDPFVVKLKDGTWRMFYKTEDSPNRGVPGGPPSAASPPEETEKFEEPKAEATVPEMDRDALGYHARSRSYEICREAGVKVVDYPDEHSFAAFYVPPDFQSGRVLVLLHGTNGTAYDEIKDELAAARERGHMLIGVQWFNFETRQYLDAAVVHRLVDRALHHAAVKDKADPGKVALCGFSRGGAVSYEVAWRDAQGHRHIKLAICHSGGVPLNAVVTPRSPTAPDVFFGKLNAGQLGADSYHGCAFFLYSGDQDEEWGARMSEQMAHAQEVLPKAGARVVEWVRQPQGRHMGFRKDPDVHAKGIRWFEELTKGGGGTLVR